MVEDGGLMEKCRVGVTGVPVFNGSTTYLKYDSGVWAGSI